MIQPIKRVTPEDIVIFHELYSKFGTYARVARETGFSASTIGRYIKLQGASIPAKHTWKEVMASTHEPAIKAK